MKRIWVSLVVIMLFSGCATPIPISQTIPVYSGKLPATIAVAVVDHRPFILNDNKEEWFEGIVRGLMYIPESRGRSFYGNNKPFASYLANKVKEALDGAGAKASVVKVPKGSSVEKAIGLIRPSHPGAGLIVMMYQSRYDVDLFNPLYGYNFELIVVGSDRKSIGRKTFEGLDRNVKLKYQYNHYDMLAELYKKKLDIFLNDPTIKSALSTAAAGS